MLLLLVQCLLLGFQLRPMQVQGLRIHWMNLTSLNDLILISGCHPDVFGLTGLSADEAGPEFLHLQLLVFAHLHWWGAAPAYFPGLSAEWL